MLSTDLHTGSQNESSHENNPLFTPNSERDFSLLSSMAQDLMMVEMQMSEKQQRKRTSSAMPTHSSSGVAFVQRFFSVRSFGTNVLDDDFILITRNKISRNFLPLCPLESRPIFRPFHYNTTFNGFPQMGS